MGAVGRGKTALLRGVKSRIRRDLDARYRRVIEIDLYCKKETNAVAAYIAQSINHTSFAEHLSLSDLVSFLHRVRYQPSFVRGPIELLLDECSEMLAEDRRNGYPLLKALRHARQRGFIHVTLCGRRLPNDLFHDWRKSMGDVQKHMKIRPLKADEGVQLLEVPLKQLNVRLASQTTMLAAIAGICKGAPRALQRWGFEIANWAARNDGAEFSFVDFKKLAQELGENTTAERAPS